MPRDTELDRLKGEQDLAFNRKQHAYEAMDAVEASFRCPDALDRAYVAKQSTGTCATPLIGHLSRMSRDGASARSYADDGHRYKQESQDCVAMITRRCV